MNGLDESVRADIAKLDWCTDGVTGQRGGSSNIIGKYLPQSLVSIRWSL
jgi:hypothetical protein